MSEYRISVTQDSSSHSMLPIIFEKQIDIASFMYKYIRSYRPRHQSDSHRIRSVLSVHNYACLFYWITFDVSQVRVFFCLKILCLVHFHA